MRIDGLTGLLEFVKNLNIKESVAVLSMAGSLAVGAVVASPGADKSPSQIERMYGSQDDDAVDLGVTTHPESEVDPSTEDDSIGAAGGGKAADKQAKDESKAEKDQAKDESKNEKDQAKDGDDQAEGGDDDADKNDDDDGDDHDEGSDDGVEDGGKKDDKGSGQKGTSGKNGGGDDD